MALAAVQTAMNLERKTLHPFFSKPSRNHDPEQTVYSDEKPIGEPYEDIESDTDPQSNKPKKKRTRKIDTRTSGSGLKNQPSLEQFTRLPQPQNTDVVTNGVNLPAFSLDEDPNAARRKRQKTASPAPPDGPHASIHPHAEQMSSNQRLQSVSGRPLNSQEFQETRSQTDVHIGIPLEEHHNIGTEVTTQNSSTLCSRLEVMNPAFAVVSSNPVSNDAKTAVLKKQLKVTKSGKLLSSPPMSGSEASTSPKKRKSRKSARSKMFPTVTVIKYGSDTASRLSLGEKIEAILSGKKSTSGRSTKHKTIPSKAPKPPKVTHPFFLGKAGPQKDAPLEERPSTPKKSAVTPGKLRAEARRERSPDAIPAFGMSASTTRSKQSGLNEPSWPTRETAHVRNLDDVEEIRHLGCENGSGLTLGPRKWKNSVVCIPKSEDLITRLAQDLHRDMRWHDDSFQPDFKPPADVRLPSRLLTTGIDIQRKVRDQVLPTAQRSDEKPPKVHPAVAALLNDIEYSLTPFDEGRCESQAWTHKYSPQCASHVLQAGKEAAILKDWLQSLTVLAVGGALKTSITLDPRKPPRKKRKKAVDDFIISDDDDGEDDMIECSDVEGAGLPYVKSFRRPQWTRDKNVILLSGPHGCGKSATVYAVAKELGFEVFEINPGMRRSGKDIQDRVGDMTANHLVNHKRAVASVKEDPRATDDTDNERMSAALQEDINSGRQGTMTSFFQTKPMMKSGAKVNAKLQENKPQNLNLRDPKNTSKFSTQSAFLGAVEARSQKQSLILFEEADILFEEDQQFWAQVSKLALNSKRPIVITCNDERQIPMQDLPLAAILRLQPTPIDLATDYMLVLAGKEGHVLERQAINDLYQSKNYDLRASISELNLWCQMSVGDRKGGLEWMYQRWPPGKDVDEHGRLLRVASEGTYRSGMGWLSHNVFETLNNVAFDKKEELAKELWADWSISPTDWDAHKLSIAPTSGILGDDRSERLKNLERLDAFAESLSATDVYCRTGLPTYNRHHDQAIDPSLPDITAKARLSYTLAASVLQVDHYSDFLNLGTSISLYSHLLCQRIYTDVCYHEESVQSVENMAESDYISSILRIQEEKKKIGKLTRFDFAVALDILASPSDHVSPERTSYILTPSSFDRTFSIITLDLAPYVRSIVAHEQVLEAQRLRISNLLSLGGSGKRTRTTRASRTALEGGVRETKRRQRWFDEDLNFELVMHTGGKEWAGLGWMGQEGEREDDVESGSLTETVDGGSSVEDISMLDLQAK